MKRQAKRPSKRAAVQNKLIAAIKREQAPRRTSGPPAWWRQLPAKTLATLEELRSNYLEGQFPGWTLRQLFERIKGELDLHTNETAFRRFVREFNGQE